MPTRTAPARRASPGRRGAALIEVLVGLVIAALLLVPLARGTAAAVRQYVRASLRDQAVALQAHALARLRADPCGGAAAGDTTVHRIRLDWSAAPQADGTRQLNASAQLVGGTLEVRGADACR